LPLITAVIPTWNRPQFLPTAIASILDAAIFASERAEVQIVVVDNSSTEELTDQSRQIAMDHGVEFRTSSPAGVSRARNEGARWGSGEYVSFLDDDDAYLPEHFVTLLDAFGRVPSAAAAFGQLLMCDAELQNPWPVAQPLPPFPSGEALLYAMNTIVVPGTVMFRRSALLEVGIYDEACKNEDWELMIRFAARYDIVGVETPICLVRQHDGNRLTNNMTYRTWVENQKDGAIVEELCRTIRGRVPVSWYHRRFGRFRLRGQSAYNALQLAFAAQNAGELRDARRFVGGAFRRSPIHAVKMSLRFYRELLSLFVPGVAPPRRHI
jgi:glycosyltransferase involved in cell wall biosynthesis